MCAHREAFLKRRVPSRWIPLQSLHKFGGPIRARTNLLDAVLHVEYSPSPWPLAVLPKSSRRSGVCLRKRVEATFVQWRLAGLAARVKVLKGVHDGQPSVKCPCSVRRAQASSSMTRVRDRPDSRKYQHSTSAQVQSWYPFLETNARLLRRRHESFALHRRVRRSCRGTGGYPARLEGLNPPCRHRDRRICRPGCG